MLEGVSDLRRGGSVTKDVEGPTVVVLRGGRSVGAKTLLRRLGAIAK